MQAKLRIYCTSWCSMGLNISLLLHFQSCPLYTLTNSSLAPGCTACSYLPALNQTTTLSRLHDGSWGRYGVMVLFYVVLIAKGKNLGKKTKLTQSFQLRNIQTNVVLGEVVGALPIAIKKTQLIITPYTLGRLPQYWKE